MRTSITHLLLLAALAAFALAAVFPRDADPFSLPTSPRLERRRGGGGGGRGGGGGGGGRSSSRSGGGSSSVSTGSRSSSNAGGQSRSGSGTPKSFGTGTSRSYSGGSTVPYTAGKKSIGTGILPYTIPLAAAAVIFPGIWYHGAYGYPYNHRVRYDSKSNDTIPVLCFCVEYSVCGCDENYNETFIQDLYRNATNDGEPKLAKISNINGTRTLVINGTLENGTTAEGGTEEVSSQAAERLAYLSGWWSMVAIVVVMCNL